VCPCRDAVVVATLAASLMEACAKLCEIFLVVEAEHPLAVALMAPDLFCTVSQLSLAFPDFLSEEVMLRVTREVLLLLAFPLFWNAGTRRGMLMLLVMS